jgi:outer membrane protein W
LGRDPIIKIITKLFKLLIMKKIFYALLLMLAVGQVAQAQEQGKFRVGLDLGYTMPDGGGGVLIAVEPKYNIADNMNIGIRFESAAMAKNVGETEADLTASGTYSGTFDYYFNSGSSSFAPFLGGGVGYSTLGNLSSSVDTELVEGSVELEVDGKFGGLIRAGFEAGKFRLAATYNLIGKTDLGEGAEIKNSYLGISLGFYLGGGKWKK